MPGDAGNLQLPTVRRPARDNAHILAILNRQAFEIECHIRSLAGGNQWRAGNLDGVACVLLISRHMNFYMRVLQRTCGLHGAQSRHDHDHAALVVTRTGANGLVTTTDEFLEGAIGFKDSVEMRNQ